MENTTSLVKRSLNDETIARRRCRHLDRSTEPATGLWWRRQRCRAMNVVTNHRPPVCGQCASHWLRYTAAVFSNATTLARHISQPDTIHGGN